MTAPVISEARVSFAPLQQATSQDVYAVGTLGQGSLDNVVENCLIAGSAYTGMSVAVSGVSGLTVQPGWLIQGGPAYALRDVFPVDLASQIAQVPDSTKSLVVLIVADGQESTTSETRTFLDASKKPTNPADPWPTVTLATNTRAIRSAIISKVVGTADVQPQAPTYNAALCLIATVVVSNTGIVSITQATGQQIVRQDQIAATVASLAAYQSTLEGTVNGLLSSVSALALGLSNLNAREQADVTSLQNQINALKILATAAPTAIFTGADYFQNLNQSNPSAAGYNAVVSGGLRFARSGGSPLVPVAAQNPYSSTLQQGTGTLIYPALSRYDSTVGIGDPGISLYGANTGGGFLAFGNLGSLSTPVYRRGFARSRVRSSIGLTASSPAQVLANGDPSQLFSIDPTTFVYDSADWGPWQTTTTEISRQNGFWSDLSSRDYWSPIEGTGDTGGLPIVSQPYQPNTSGMLDKLTLTNNGATSGNVRLLICADNNGKPDFTRTFADVTSVLSNPPGTFFGHLVFQMPYPILLKGGVGYHFVFTSDNPAFEIWAPTGSNGNGNFYLAYANGAWSAPQANTRLSMNLSYASFPNPTVRIPVAPLQLAGGGDTVDFQTKILLPEGCTLGFEIYIGGAWVSLAQVLNSTYPLAGNPSNVPCNMVLTGTGQVAPIIDTTASVYQLSKSSAALDHVSSVQTPTAPVTTIHKSVTVNKWNSGVQTLTANLRTGTGYTTNTAPTATKDTINADGSLTRQWTWGLGAAVPSFEMEMIGATTDPTQTFVGLSSNWDASP